MTHSTTEPPRALRAAETGPTAIAQTATAPETSGTSFIGSFVEEPDGAQIVLRGDIDAAAVARVGVHIEGLCVAGMRFLVIDAAAVDSYDQALLDLLGRTQNRLTRRGPRGMLQVRGLHPSLLAVPEPGPDPRSSSVAGARTGSVPTTAS